MDIFAITKIGREKPEFYLDILDKIDGSYYWVQAFRKKKDVKETDLVFFCKFKDEEMVTSSVYDKIIPFKESHLRFRTTKKKIIEKYSQQKRSYIGFL